MARTGKAQNFRHGIDVVTLLSTAPRALGVSEIATALGLAKSSAHDLLRALTELGFIEFRGRRYGYTISPGIMACFRMFGRHFVERSGLAAVLKAESTRTGLSVYLCRLAESLSVVVGAHIRDGSVLTLGASEPVLTSSAGKVLVAAGPEEEWARYVPECQGAALEAFLGELREARRSGVAWNFVHREIGVISVAALVPRPGKARPDVAAALVMTPEEHALRRVPEWEQEVVEVASRIGAI